MRTGTWWSPRRPGPACPTNSGRGSTPTPTATNTWWSAERRSWPFRWARWPGRAPPSTTRPPSARWPRRNLAVRTPWPAWPTWTPRASTRLSSTPPSASTSRGRGAGRRRGAGPGLQRLARRLLCGRPAPPLRGGPAPAAGPGAAADELRRAVSDLGFVAGFVRPNPCAGRSLPDRAYEPLWRAAEELDVPIGVHEGSSVSCRRSARTGPSTPCSSTPCPIRSRRCWPAAS